jgi:hypothetical protein
VTLTASNGLGSHTLTKKCYIEVELLNEINSPEIHENQHLYPNPASEIITLTSGENTLIRIFNILGELVYTDPDEKKLRQVDVTNFPGGIYIVRFEGFGSMHQEKLLIQH